MREAVALRYYADLSEAQTADAMGVSINTVSFHLKNAYCKLGVHSKTEAVVKGLLEGFLLPEYAVSQQAPAG